MRTKTLLVAAAALAAAITSSQAQTVYSQNVVGYVNTVLSGGAFTLVNNPLNGTTNGAEQLMPGLQGGENLFIWNGHGYFIYTFQGPGAGASFASGNGLSTPYQSDWTDGGAFPDPGPGFGPGVIPGDQTDTTDNLYWAPQPVITPGQGFFVQNPNTTETNTFTGTVVTTNSQTIAGGSFSLVGSAIPVAGNAETNTVLNLTAGFQGGENVFVWTGHGYFIYTFQGAGAGASFASGNGLSTPYQSDWTDGGAFPDPGPGFGPGIIPGDQTDTTDNLYWAPALQLSVGQGIFVQNPNTADKWTQTITNIP